MGMIDMDPSNHSTPCETKNERETILTCMSLIYFINIRSLGLDYKNKHTSSLDAIMVAQGEILVVDQRHQRGL